MISNRVQKPWRLRLSAVFPLLLVLAVVAPPAAAGADSVDECSLAEVTLYLNLAKASERAYDDSPKWLETTPSGCVALVRKDKLGNLVIAFRGSMLGDRNPKHPFSNLGGANIRRNYRDWAATNLKQVSGFLPRQYIEAAALVEDHVLEHPVDKQIFITGHSKGGGAAAFAYVAACLSPRVSPERAKRMRAVVFNPAVVKEQNWRRLFRTLGLDEAGSEREPSPRSITALCMRDDPVSKIGAGEEREYVRRIIIAPTGDYSAIEQHGIGVIIKELSNRRDAIAAER